MPLQKLFRNFLIKWANIFVYPKNSRKRSFVLSEGCKKTMNDAKNNRTTFYHSNNFRGNLNWEGISKGKFWKFCHYKNYLWILWIKWANILVYPKNSGKRSFVLSEGFKKNVNDVKNNTTTFYQSNNFRENWIGKGFLTGNFENFAITKIIL